jgi:hypothetical protein
LIKKIYICDRCKKEKVLTSYDLPVFETVYALNPKNIVVGKFNHLEDKKRIDLCEDCKRELANIITLYLENFEEGRK